MTHVCGYDKRFLLFATVDKTSNGKFDLHAILAQLNMHQQNHTRVTTTEEKSKFITIRYNLLLN